MRGIVSLIAMVLSLVLIVWADGLTSTLYTQHMSGQNIVAPPFIATLFLMFGAGLVITFSSRIGQTRWGLALEALVVALPLLSLLLLSQGHRILRIPNVGLFGHLSLAHISALALGSNIGSKTSDILKR